MPHWFWIEIGVLVAIAAGILLWVLYKRGGSVKVGRNTISVAGDAVDDAHVLMPAIRYVERSVGELQDIFYTSFLRALRDKGYSERHLTEYEDSRFAKLLIWHIVAGGNGTDSAQKIIEREILNGDWYEGDLERYVEQEVWPPLKRFAKRIVNAEYDSDVLEEDGYRRQRMISNKEFVDVLTKREVKEQVVVAIIPFFEYARQHIPQRRRSDR